MSFAAGQLVRKTYFRRRVLLTNQFSHCQWMCQKKKKKENALVQEHSIYLKWSVKKRKKEKERTQQGFFHRTQRTLSLINVT